jgi:aspartate/methionine/tyrosine aminotransferase
MFSARVPADLSPNPLAAAVERMRLTGRAFADLTVSNPTEAGFDYPPSLLEPLSSAESLRYDPQPFGLSCARAAVSADYHRRGLRVPASHVVLTASSSESYSLLFKLLCDPGDSVLVPTPSYPLFEHLTRLDNVQARPYRAEYHGAWQIDVEDMRYAITDTTRAGIYQSNHPYRRRRRHAPPSRWHDEMADAHLPLSLRDVASLIDPRPGRHEASSSRQTCCRSSRRAVEVDRPASIEAGWMALSGPGMALQGALMRLELIADTYLSVGTPVQIGAKRLLEEGRHVRQQIHRRVVQNYGDLTRIAQSYAACQVLRAEGGWSAVIRVPHTIPEDERVIRLLEEEHVLVHPGYFFDFPRDGYFVVSLLAWPDVFREAVGRMFATVART